MPHQLLVNSTPPSPNVVTPEIIPPAKMFITAVASTSVHLTPLEKWIAFLANSGYYTLCLPVRFDASRGILQMTENKLIKGICFFRLIYLALDNIYLICIAHKVTREPGDEKEFSDFWMHTGSRMVGCFVSWLVALDMKSTVETVNAMIETRRCWRRKFGIWSEEFQGPLELLIRRSYMIAILFVPFQSILPLILHFQARHSSRYWGAELLPRALYDSPPGIVLAGINDFVLSQATINTSVFGIAVVVSFMVHIRFWTVSIMNKVAELGLSSKIPLLQYKSLLTLNRLFNSCNGQTIIPAMVFVGSGFISLMLSVLIKRNRDLPLVALINLMLGCGLCIMAEYLGLEGAGRMRKRSLDLKRELKMRPDLYVRKFVDSCQEMRMDVGNYFYVKSGTFVNCMKWIIDQAITIILTF
ncbi:unnamed protein product [Orchesella dallaii]|uniref:Odorant receptor n=1 Tax=Orchesella dallaii TaxID=48710 RepID=A0ABP1SAF1_9HEXA